MSRDNSQGLSNYRYVFRRKSGSVERVQDPEHAEKSDSIFSTSLCFLIYKDLDYYHHHHLQQAQNKIIDRDDDKYSQVFDKVKHLRKNLEITFLDV
ncbi:hypothetical protein RCL_jg4965.t2 [Rhizophagus clarus]|uniref:Uncharacterized protein n=1 Tax=Rhizophagus clarus TaxID=94130 RepID=A0A8H3QMS6_9GLOM|nr:hypothetical protein RCL_jg4965.t2 [Rhizophagus clarus]